MLESAQPPIVQNDMSVGQFYGHTLFCTVVAYNASTLALQSDLTKFGYLGTLGVQEFVCWGPTKLIQPCWVYAMRPYSDSISLGDN